MKRTGNNRAMMASKTRIPEGWRLVRLGDVAEANRSGWSRSDDATILYLDLTSIVVPGIMSCPKELAAAEAPSRARRRVHSGDILVSTVRPNLRGFARVREAPKNLIASTGFAVLTPMSDVDGSYVYHHVMTQQFADYLEKATTGQAYPAVRPADVTNFVLPIPPLPEQRAIAAVLDAIDDAIERTDAVIAATEQLRDSLLHELLNLGVPGWHTEWKEAPGLGTIPADWEVVRLGDVAEVGFSSVDKKSVKGELPVRLCNYIDVFYNRRIRTEMDFMVATANPVERKRWSLKRGDVLFTKDSETPDEIGIPAFVEADMPNVLCGYHLGLARPDAQLLDGAYLAEAFASPKLAVQFARIANGVTRFGLTLGATTQLPIPLPPLAEQQAIAGLLDGVDVTVAEAKREREGLQLLKESTADALLTGRVRVLEEELFGRPRQT